MFDQASVIEQAQSHKRISDLKDRLTLVHGSFREAVPVVNAHPTPTVYSILEAIAS